MWSPSRALGAALLTLALAAPLAGCTGFTPVYGERGLGMERARLSYAEPRNRLEQIIYQDLALRLGRSDGAVPVVNISASQSSSALTADDITAPNTPRQVTVTAKVTLTDIDGTVLLSGSRSQTADVNTDSQALANQEAIEDAGRRAAKLLADTIRLEIVAALAR